MECEDGTAKFALRFGHGDGLWSSTMTKQSAISARHQGVGVPDEGHHRIAVRGYLPFVAAHGSQTKQRPRDLEECRAAAAPVEGLQHPSVSLALLPGQPSVGRDGAAMQAGEQAIDGFQPVEALKPERHQGDAAGKIQTAGKGHQLKPFAIGEAEECVATVLRFFRAGSRVIDPARRPGPGCERWRSLVEDNDARVLFRQPEDVRLGGCLLGIERGKTTSIGDGNPPSVPGRLHQRKSWTRSHDHRPRSGAAIPRPCRRRSGPRHTHTRPKTTIAKGQVTPGSPFDLLLEQTVWRLPGKVVFLKLRSRQRAMRRRHHSGFLRWLSRTSSR